MAEKTTTIIGTRDELIIKLVSGLNFADGLLVLSCAVAAFEQDNGTQVTADALRLMASNIEKIPKP